MEATKVINMSEYVETPDEVKILAMHGRTMLMMYEATGESRYLARARADYHRARSILRSGFVRPLGVIMKEAA